MATTKPERRGASDLVRASASALLSMASASQAATSPPVQPTLAVSAVVTDNAQLASDDQKRSDVIGDVNAGVIVRSRGARVNVNGDVGLEFVGYARDSEPSRVLPRGRIDLNAILVERALFFDGELSAVRTRSDPLAAQSDSVSTANTVSSVSLRASPYFAHEFTPLVSAGARSDTVVTRNHQDGSSGGSVPDGSTYQHDVANITRKAAPVGFSLDASHENTTYQNDDTSVLRTDFLQATLSAALDTDLVAGLVGGREHARYAGVSQDDTTYGAMLQWHPSSRTALDLDAEHHYFGTGWNLHFRDRLPRTTVDLSLTRMASASASSFGLTGPDSDPTLLLAGLLSNRPGDTDSGTANTGTSSSSSTGTSTNQSVDQFVQARGLPTTFSQPLQITSESAQLATRAALNLIHTGPRDTLYASAWYQKATALPGAAPTPLATTFDSRQWGGSLGLYHRLTPQVSGGAEIEWSTIEGLGARDGDSQRQVTGTLSLTQRLGPRTTLSAGLRHFAAHVVLNSTSTTTEVRENQAFAGLRVQY